MGEQREKSATPGGFWQIARFGIVGVINTAIDFLVTNLLVFYTGAERALALVGISLLACGIATLNSYILNRNWTFSSSNVVTTAGTIARFYAVTFCAIVVNTSLFLFFYRYLSQMGCDKLVSVNLAKFVGVGVASVVSFLGFKLTVFDRTSQLAFRNQFRFPGCTDHFFSWYNATILLALSLAVRGSYLWFTNALIGEAATSLSTAQTIASGAVSQVDPFWVNPFVFGVASLIKLGVAPLISAIGVSLAMGALLPLPVFWMAGSLYGDRVGWFAGILTAVHPRLVEYSCNGDPESLYLLSFSLGVLGIVLHLQGKASFWSLLYSGVGFGIASLLRVESLIPTSLYFLGSIGTAGSWSTAWGRGSRFAAGVMITLLVYSGWSVSMLGSAHLFSHGQTLLEPYSVQMQPREAARKAYGDGQYSDPGQEFCYFQKIKNNLRYSLQSMPGVWLTPLCLLMFFLPIVHRQSGQWKILWPLVVMLGFPLLFYPALKVEPIYFFLTLIPIQVFGAAGWVAICSYLGLRLWGFLLTAGALIVLSLALTWYRAFTIEQGFHLYRTLASWIKVNMATDDLLVGDGQGYVTTTAVLAGRPYQVRLWTDSPQKLEQFLRMKDAHWLIVFEEYLKKANPELLPVLDEGFPNLRLRYETLDRSQNRVQIYESPNDRW